MSVKESRFDLTSSLSTAALRAGSVAAGTSRTASRKRSVHAWTVASSDGSNGGLAALAVHSWSECSTDLAVLRREACERSTAGTCTPRLRAAVLAMARLPRS